MDITIDITDTSLLSVLSIYHNYRCYLFINALNNIDFINRPTSKFPDIQYRLYNNFAFYISFLSTLKLVFPFAKPSKGYRLLIIGLYRYSGYYRLLQRYLDIGSIKKPNVIDKIDELMLCMASIISILSIDLTFECQILINRYCS